MRDVMRELDWERIGGELDAAGCAVLPGLLPDAGCEELAALYDQDDRFRSRVIMARHGFGRGEYKYFAHPLPGEVARLRGALYPPLSAIANRWNEAMGVGVRYPDDHAAFLETLPRRRPDPPHAAAPALRRGGLQLPAPGPVRRARVPAADDGAAVRAPDATSPEASSFSPSSVPACSRAPRWCRWSSGDGVIFPVQRRPVQGTRGTYRVALRHGVSRVRSGRRHTLGIIFHDAE